MMQPLLPSCAQKFKLHFISPYNIYGTQELQETSTFFRGLAVLAVSLSQPASLRYQKRMCKHPKQAIIG